MYFKVVAAPNHYPLLFSEDRRFDLYWRLPVDSLRPDESDLSLDDLDVARILMSLWRKKNLDLKLVLGDEASARAEVVAMSGDLTNLVNLCRRLLSEDQPQETGRDCAVSGNVEATGSSVALEIPPPKGTEKGGSPDLEVTFSHPAKKRKKGKKTELGKDPSSGKIFDESFDPMSFIDKHLMSRATEEALESVPLEDVAIRAQRMLLQAVVFCYDIQKEVGDLALLRQLVDEKNKNVTELSAQRKKLEASAKSKDSRIAVLVGEAETLKNDREASDKRIYELVALLKGK
ncbi:hypothetical protein PIB30_069187 [Stylosanthes scabra]|uniref:Uncharacterized protein n=1 Tax=Stylosanthes scabra TaxID=79078 RepID=A0ABU6XNE0_9FABA|nr:hypothetical protein [Stylosanthes scabra]